MDVDTLITAGSGLLGVLIGGGITAWATWWSSKVQRDHHNRVVQHEKVTAIWEHIQGNTWREHGTNHTTDMELEPGTRQIGTYPTLGNDGERLAQSALLHATDQDVRERLEALEAQFHALSEGGMEAWSWAMAHRDTPNPSSGVSAVLRLENSVTELTQAVTALAKDTRKLATGQK